MITEEKKSMAQQKYSSAFKVKTVLEGLKSPDGSPAYCRRKGISDVLFYQWQKQLISNADAVFEKTSNHFHVNRRSAGT